MLLGVLQPPNRHLRVLAAAFPLCLAPDTSWGIEGPAEGTLLSRRRERGAGPAPESLTASVDKASTGACSATRKSHTTPSPLCFSFMLFYSSTARGSWALRGREEACPSR